jgi:subtilisin family serine protease
MRFLSHVFNAKREKMPTNYLVLRATVPLDEGVEFTKPSAWETKGAGADLTAHVVSGHETDAGDLRADPKNAAVMDADVMLSLITPRASAANEKTALTLAGTIKMPAGLIAVKAHTSPFTGQGVTVAVLDTGLDDSHPAFTGKTIVKRDFTGEGANATDVSDKDGHGTHCAGTVCGTTVDGIRVGVAPGVTKVCIGKVLDKNGGSLEMFIKGMMWAVMDEKALIVSMSLGYDLPRNVKRLVARGVDPALAAQAAMNQQSDIIKGVSTLRAFLEWQSNNVIFAAASGNESARPKFVLDAGLPAAELFAVGAVGATAAGDKWQVADFSNGRAQVAAPGVDVVSAAAGGGWASKSGTSMATPHVAGVAALWAEKLRNQGGLIAPSMLRAAIMANADRQPLLNPQSDATGVGLVQCPQ